MFYSKGNPTNMQQLEYFAGHFSANVRNSDGEKNKESEYFPNSVGTMNDIVQQMADKVNGGKK